MEYNIGGNIVRIDILSEHTSVSNKPMYMTTVIGELCDGVVYVEYNGSLHCVEALIPSQNPDTMIAAIIFMEAMDQYDIRLSGNEPFSMS